MAESNYDIIIVGGGVMGSATAYYLMKADERLKVAVVEMDPSYSHASSTLSMANIRTQFSLEENIRISQYAFEVLDSFADTMAVEDNIPDVCFRHEGNLFLFDEDHFESGLDTLKIQQDLGCTLEWWIPEKIRQRFPLYDPEGLAGGTFGSNDGHIDAYAMLMGFKAKARHLGAIYLSDEVTQLIATDGSVTGVLLASGERLDSGVVVNCAGAWAAQVAQTAGIQLPVEPVKRQVFVLDTAVKPDGPLPLTVLPSGLYFRTETGGYLLLGKSMASDKVGFDFNWDDKRFMDVLWPELATFVPAFDTAKLIRGWAGLYAVNRLDGNAILGPWPLLRGLFLANGFSGHGLQQAPAVGRYISELITGRKPSLDLSVFSPERILENKPLSEGGLV
jgi:glycine/D-amino acid oxidase-like deaminating enzyme